MRHLAAAAILLATSAAAQDLYVRDSDEGYLNLRGGPGTHHAVIRRLSPGDRVSVEEEMGKWARVRLPSGERGWAALDYLERGAPAVGDTLFVTTAGAGWLNLRSGPGTGFDVLRRMYPGDRIVPLEERGDWLRVRHVSGATGWAHGSYLEK